MDVYIKALKTHIFIELRGKFPNCCITGMQKSVSPYFLIILAIKLNE
jgi:hypothetical protein